MNKTHIIIGTAAAGVGVMNKLRQLEPTARIIAISDEPELPYNKCFLADYLGGNKNEQQIGILTQEKVALLNITLLLGKRVMLLSPDKKTITLNDGQVFAYDTLFIGTGSTPFIPPIAGMNGPGVFTFYNLADTNAIMNYVREHNIRTAAVIGAGLSGLECADGLLKHGVISSVIEMRHQVLGDQVDAEGAQLIQQYMHSAGVAFYPHEQVIAIEREDKRVTGVQLKSGGTVQADMIIIAAGLRANSQLAQGTDIALQGHGILVDDYMCTSVLDIFAGGDVAVVTDQISGNKVQSCTWPDAMLQGMIAAHGMAGMPKKYPGAAVVTSSAFFGTKFVSCGRVVPGQDDEHIVRRAAGIYQAFIMRNRRLKGFVLVGNVAPLSTLRRVILTQEEIDIANL